MILKLIWSSTEVLRECYCNLYRGILKFIQDDIEAYKGLQSVSANYTGDT